MGRPHLAEDLAVAVDVVAHHELLLGLVVALSRPVLLVIDRGVVLVPIKVLHVPVVPGVLLYLEVHGLAHRCVLLAALVRVVDPVALPHLVLVLQMYVLILWRWNLVDAPQAVLAVFLLRALVLKLYGAVSV